MSVSAKFAVWAWICVSIFCSCTENDGGESRLYGQWQLTDIECSSEKIAEGIILYDTYLRFQSTTVQICYENSDHGTQNGFGNYRLDDNTLFLNFPDSGINGSPLLNLSRECELQVLHLSSNRLTLEYQPEESEYIIYYFRKW